MNSKFISQFLSRFPTHLQTQIIKYAIIVGLHKINNKYNLSLLQEVLPSIKKYTIYAKSKLKQSNIQNQSPQNRENIIQDQGLIFQQRQIFKNKNKADIAFKVTEVIPASNPNTKIKQKSKHDTEIYSVQLKRKTKSKEKKSLSNKSKQYSKMLATHQIELQQVKQNAQSKIKYLIDLDKEKHKYEKQHCSIPVKKEQQADAVETANFYKEKYKSQDRTDSNSQNILIANVIKNPSSVIPYDQRQQEPQPIQYNDKKTDDSIEFRRESFKPREYLEYSRKSDLWNESKNSFIPSSNKQWRESATNVRPSGNSGEFSPFHRSQDYSIRTSQPLEQNDNLMVIDYYQQEPEEFQHSSVSSTFSMFQPNEELKQFFIHDLIRKTDADNVFNNRLSVTRIIGEQNS